MTGPDLQLINPDGKKTIIYEYEFFAVSIAFDVCADLVQGKQVVFFSDNNAVRDSLIASKPNSRVASCFLQHILSGGSSSIQNFVVRQSASKKQHRR